MSKAFASNDSDDNEANPVKAPVLPPGVRNYITPAGAVQLETERERLIAQRAALSDDTVESKARKRVVEQSLEIITEHLNRAQIVDPLKQSTDRVLFGATVTVRDDKGSERTWRIVGINETDLAKGWVSWLSPLARALLDKKLGDSANFGDQKLTLLNIEYRSA